MFTHARSATAVRNMHPLAVLGFLTAVALATLFPPSYASAAALPFKEAFGSAAQPALGNPAGMAVDPATGDLLVIDLEDKTLHRYNSDGTPSEFTATGTNVIDGHEGGEDATPSGEILSSEFGVTSEVQVAVAPPGAAGGTEGDIYVTNAFNGSVEIFESTGKYVASKEVAIYPCGVAVDPAGNLYVGNYEGGAGEGVHKYTPTAPGTFTESPNSPFAATTPCQLAAGGGYVYATTINSSVTKIDAEGAEEGVTDYVVDTLDNGAGPISLDPVSGFLFVVKPGALPDRPVREYDVSGESSASLISETPLASEGRGVAADGSTESLFVTRAGATGVEVFEFETSPPVHALTITKAGSGNGTVTCSIEEATFAPCPSTINDGAKVEIKATASKGSTFAGFSAGTGPAETCSNAPTVNPCVINEFLADSSLTATFNELNRTLGVTIVGNGEVECEVEGGGPETCAPEYSDGTELTLVPIPDSHFQFEGFSAGTGSASACTGTPPCTFTITTNSTVTATFTQITHALTITKAGTGTGTVECSIEEAAFAPCPATVNDGAKVEVKATPALHSTFAGFSGTGSAAACTTSPCVIGEFLADSTLTATFNKIIHTFSVTNKGTGTGSVTCSINEAPFAPCPATIDEGAKVEIKATASAGSSFGGFEGTGSAGGCTTSPCTIGEYLLDSTLKATFTKNTHTLVITIAGTGTGTVECKVAAGAFGPCPATVNESSKVEIKATPAAGSSFTGFSAGTGSAASCSATNPCVINAFNLDSTLTATFNKITHTLAVSSAGTGSGSVTCNGGPCAPSYDEGTSITLAATAAAGSTFAGFSGACTGTSCTVVLNADSAVTATFNKEAVVPPPVKCVVPKLAKKSLNQAKTALKKAHCKLGKVTKPKPKKGKKQGPLIVKSSSPGAGRSLAENAKVNLKLGPKPKKGKK